VALKYEMNHEKKAIWQHTKLSYASSPKAIVPKQKVIEGNSDLGNIGGA
jgi:hypothetical protein